MQKVKYFFLGAVCFAVFQGLLRLPFISFLTRQIWFIYFIQFSFANYFFLGFTAGFFEETGRLIFKKLIIWDEDGFSQPLFFALGHGMVEAFSILLVPIIKNGLTIAIVLELISAIGMHVGLTFIIWNGIKEKKAFFYWLLAVVLHSLIDSSIGFFLSAGLSLLIIELIFSVVALFFLLYAVITIKSSPVY